MDSAFIGNLTAMYGRFGTLVADSIRTGQINAANLTAGNGTIGGNLRSSNFVGGTSGWILRPDGYAELSNVVIRGATYTGTIYAGSGRIGNFVINADDIRSSNYSAGVGGLRLNSDGSAEIYNLTARGNITANSLNAATGSFGTVSIVSGGSINLGQTAFNSGSGFWLGDAGGAAKFSIGSPTGPHLNFDSQTNILDISDPSFGAFTAFVVGGDLSSSVGNGARVYGSKAVSITGGKAPYVYEWTVSCGSNTYGHNGSAAPFGSNDPLPFVSQIWLTGGSTNSSVTIAGAGYDSVLNTARLFCFVRDSNGRTTVATCLVQGTHTGTYGGASSGGEGGSSP